MNENVMPVSTRAFDETKDFATPEFLEEIASRLRAEKRVRRRLPGKGRLHIDRRVPFLCVHRRMPETGDSGTPRLVLGESAHLIASGAPQWEDDLSELVGCIVRSTTEEFGAFLLLEIWAAPSDAPPSASRFRIFTPKSAEVPAVIGHLEEALRAVDIPRCSFEVEVKHGKVSPLGCSALFTTSQARALGLLMIGLEVPAIYLDASGALLPAPFRALQKELSRVLQQTFFHFMHTHTKSRPVNYQSLGRRAPVRAVWEIDEQLAKISEAFQFLLAVTPVNVESGWNDFQSSNFSQSPVFHYRWLSIEPDLLKRELYDIRLERVEDPTLATLLREKRNEMSRQITMLDDRDTPNFLHGSLQVYGGVDEDFYRLALSLLEQLPRKGVAASGHVSAGEFAERARQEIGYYAQMLPSFKASVEVLDGVAGILVSQGNLLLSTHLKISNERVAPLLQHEVGTHLLTYYNGRAQRLRLMYTGLPDYEELQEGLAVLAEYFVGGLSPSRLRLLAARVVAVHALQNGASFIETFRLLNNSHAFAPRTTFDITMRVFRGGGLTKDAVYLRGLVQLLKYLGDGGAMEPLFCGKISLGSVAMVQELQWREIVSHPRIYPHYLDSEEAQKKLQLLRNGLSLGELIQTN